MNAAVITTLAMQSTGNRRLLADVGGVLIFMSLAFSTQWARD